MPHRKGSPKHIAFKARYADRQRVLVRLSKQKARGIPPATRPMPEFCECCGLPPNGNGVLHNDHDHITGKFRGWLCARCNVGIGMLQDGLEGVLNAVIYLTNVST